MDGIKSYAVDSKVNQREEVAEKEAYALADNLLSTFETKHCREILLMCKDIIEKRLKDNLAEAEGIAKMHANKLNSFIG